MDSHLFTMFPFYLNRVIVHQRVRGSSCYFVGIFWLCSLFCCLLFLVVFRFCAFPYQAACGFVIQDDFVLT